MSSSNFTLPEFKGSTVEVSILNGGMFDIASQYIILNPVSEHDSLNAPCLSFLVENKKLGKKILFDLGFMKAWQDKQSPTREILGNHQKLYLWMLMKRNIVLGQIEAAKPTITIERDIPEQLKEANITLESINSIIWSHHHVDHRGDPSLFPQSVSLVVGPGFKSDKTLFPGYPKNPDALTVDDAFEGQNVIELDFSSTGLDIGGFAALDIFGDGSFYLLAAPGHSECVLLYHRQDI
jgi:hypothetical protein